MIVDGKKIAQEILERTKARAAALPRPPRVIAVVSHETAATRSYLAIKLKRAAEAGCDFEVRALGVDTSDADAIIVQLPLMGGIDTQAVLNAIPIEKDADVLSQAARAQGTLLPPVVAAIREIFIRNGVEPRGKKAVVIGRGWLVGAPAAAWLKAQGATVEVLTSQTQSMTALATADIIVSGAGVPHFIKPAMIKDGAVLIDAGTSESGGTIVGDADPAGAPKCSVFTPVPGGVGPIAVACLFENAVTLTEHLNSTNP
jgi:methylenetetrahydrofolate dehydrogenase (NADP+) / methenyltetrahydrofolate cyclohydrolase